MKLSEEYKQEANITLTSGIYFSVLVLILLGAALIKGVVILVVGFSIILCVFIVIFAITYWSDKKTQQELERGENQEEREK